MIRVDPGSGSGGLVEVGDDLGDPEFGGIEPFTAQADEERGAGHVVGQVVDIEPVVLELGEDRLEFGHGRGVAAGTFALQRFRERQVPLREGRSAVGAQALLRELRDRGGELDCRSQGLAVVDHRQERGPIVDGDRAVVFSAMGSSSSEQCTYGYECVPRADGSRTTMSVFDIADRAEAERWLARVDSPDALLQVQTRRAQALLKAGDVERARALIRGVPAQGDEALRARWVAEYQLLRDAKHNVEALAVVQEARTRFPADSDLTYDEAMIAERLGRHADAERLLREVIKLKPEDPQAYNALGYSMADRGVRLPEARQLILKAVEAAPDDPFIQDSLGWVEYRMGNLPAALRILEAAYKRRADAEIAAHLGEVLWKRGEQERARVVWREGLQTQPDNDTLRETLQRFKVKP